MEVFVDLKRYAAILGVKSSHGSTGKHLYNSITVSILITHGIDLFLSSEYMFKDAQSFDEYVDVFFRITSLISCIVFFASIVWNLPELRGFIQNLENIIRTRIKYSDEAETLYTTAATKVQKRMDLFVITVQKFTPISMILPKYIICLLTYYSTDLGPDAFELPIPKWYPFDWRTPMGYSVACVSQYITCLAIFSAMSCTVVLQVKSVSMLISMTEDVKCDILAINKINRARQNLVQISTQIANIVRFHSRLKQLVKDYARLFQTYYMTLFLWSVSGICLSLTMIQIQLWQSASYSAMVLFLSWQISCSLAFIFLVCNLGHRIGKAFDDVDFTVLKLHWYKFPIEAHRMLPILIIGTQQPVELEVFGSASCTYENFQKVVNKGYSFFMLLRQFGWH